VSFEIKKQDKQKQKEEIFCNLIWGTLDDSYVLDENDKE